MYFFEHSDEFLCGVGGLGTGFFGVAMTQSLSGFLFFIVGVLMTLGIVWYGRECIHSSYP